MSLLALKMALKSYASPERKKANARFFKTGKGEYGEGDKFIGVSMPNIRKVAQQFKDLKLGEIKKVLTSPMHEERMAALVILVDQFKKGDEEAKKQIFDFYLKNDKHINNWDLVDLSAPKIVGAYILQHPAKQSILTKYAKSSTMWRRRIAILGTFPLIAQDSFDLSFKIATTLLSDQEDLTHKALGWMLREIWKRDQTRAEAFLKKHYDSIPRTTLRYAIEKMPEAKRKKFLAGLF